MTTRRDLFRLLAGATSMVAVPETIYGVTIAGLLPIAAEFSAVDAMMAAMWRDHRLEPTHMILSPAEEAAWRETIERNEFEVLVGEPLPA